MSEAQWKSLSIDIGCRCHRHRPHLDVPTKTKTSQEGRRRCRRHFHRHCRCHRCCQHRFSRCGRHRRRRRHRCLLAKQSHWFCQGGANRCQSEPRRKNGGKKRPTGWLHFFPFDPFHLLVLSRSSPTLSSCLNAQRLGRILQKGDQRLRSCSCFLVVVVVVAYKWEKLGDEILRTTFWSTACAFLSLLNQYWCFVA